MRRVFLGCCLFFLSVPIGAQTPLDWSDFEKGIFWDQDSNINTVPGFVKADFSNSLQQLEGKEISLIGFLIVLNNEESVQMLSKNPMASCFFCGNGGPETIAEVIFSEKVTYQMDDLISVTGILRLNRDDATRCYYLIEEAKAFKF